MGAGDDLGPGPAHRQQLAPRAGLPPHQRERAPTPGAPARSWRRPSTPFTGRRLAAGRRQEELAAGEVAEQSVGPVAVEGDPPGQLAGLGPRPPADQRAGGGGVVVAGQRGQLGAGGRDRHGPGQRADGAGHQDRLAAGGRHDAQVAVGGAGRERLGPGLDAAVQPGEPGAVGGGGEPADRAGGALRTPRPGGSREEEQPAAAAAIRRRRAPRPAASMSIHGVSSLRARSA